MNECADADLVHRARKIEGARAGRAYPPLYRHLSVLGINAHGNPIPKGTHEFRHKVRAFRGAGANDHPADAEPKGTIDGGPGAKTAPQLDLHPQLCDRRDRGGILGFTGEGPIQVHHVDPGGSRRLKPPRNLHGVQGVYSFLISKALRQSDASATLDIYCWIYCH